jgi:heptosyltransferase-3
MALWRGPREIFPERRRLGNLRARFIPTGGGAISWHNGAMPLLFSRTLISAQARMLRVLAGRRPKARSPEAQARILCLTRAGIGEMVDTVPLFHALRRHYPHAHLAVACDPAVAPLAQACESVNEVIVLKRSWIPWKAALQNGARLQHYDWVVAAKGACDSRLAVLARLSNAAIRVGFERRGVRHSAWYTDSVALPDRGAGEHRIDTLLRLLKPLGVVKTTGWSADLSLRVPDSARELAAEIREQPPFEASPGFILINLSGATPPRFREQDFIELAGRVLSSTHFVIGLTAAPADEPKAAEIAMCMGSKRIVALNAMEPLELAALIEEAAFLITPENDVAHLAAGVGTPALILWSRGDFKKCHSRGRRHVFVHAEPNEKNIPVERVWQALQSFLAVNDDVQNQWTRLQELPPGPDFMP